MKKGRNYIGLATTAHDPAIAIVNNDGEVVFAEGLERHLQDKRAFMATPDNLMFVDKLIDEYCNPDFDLVISTSWSNDFLDKMHRIADDPVKFKEYLIKYSAIYDENRISFILPILQYIRTQTGIIAECWYNNKHPNAQVIRRSYNHHLTHATYACYTSPFEEAVCAAIDGYGEDVSTACYHFKNDKLQLISAPQANGSLGTFYAIICMLCGFNGLAGEEWKVMGLASYGKFNKEYYDLFNSMIFVDDISIRCPSNFNSIVKELLLKQRLPNQPALDYADIAYTGQLVFSEIMNKFLKNLYDRGFSENLALAGGCMLNSSFMGKVLLNTPFKKCFVPSAPADDGNAIGAALAAFYEDNPDHKRTPKVQSPYLGNKLSPKRLGYLKRFGNINSIHFDDDDSLCKYVAEQMADGKIIGWAQGRAEFGPRALGNRSILADPRKAAIKEIINDRVKFREEFRPFAPSILAEFGNEYFHNYYDTPYMERTLVFKEEVRDKIPGVVHVDGTGRLQSVHKELNPRYASLIRHFYDITGIPLVLNTSFNVMSKPIVNSVEDALAVFYTSGIDVLVLENDVFLKNTV